MVSLPAEAVVAASNDWAWVPDDAETVQTDEYLLVRFPRYFEHELELIRFSPAGRLADAVAAVLDRARAFGLPDLYWFARLDGPAGVPELLAARGATVDVTLDVLARPLPARPGTDGTAATAGPAASPALRGLELRWQTGPAIARDAAVLGAEVFGGSVPPDDRIAENAARGRATVASGEGGTIVAYADGVPVGVGGVSIVGEVARLWGGAVAERARGRGVYRAVLAARLAYAEAHGATMALVKGKIQTSGPILRRAGFAAYGQETIFRVPLALPRRSARRTARRTISRTISRAARRASRRQARAAAAPPPITPTARHRLAAGNTVAVGEGSRNVDNARGKTARGDFTVLRAVTGGCRHPGGADAVEAGHAERTRRGGEDPARAAGRRSAGGGLSRRGLPRAAVRGPRRRRADARGDGGAQPAYPA
jgi:GNAT superfamily N-acetyltransferase